MEKIVVGAGPIGLFTGARSAETTIYDRKKDIGKPVQCTGLVTNQIEQLLDKKTLQAITLNKIAKTEIIGPHSKTTLKLSPNYIIDNSLFEEKLADQVLARGNEIHLNKRYEGSSKGKHRFKDLRTKKKESIQGNELVGVDGPYSSVRAVHQFKELERYVGIQARIKVKEHENNIKFFPHIGKYAWYVPETEHVARVGLAASKAPEKLFQTFLKQFPGRIIERQGGIIPLHKPLQRTILQTTNYRVVLLGDAAGHIKNTTGGGLIPGMVAASHYASENKQYKDSPKELRRELYTHFLVHNLLSQAKSKDWDVFIKESRKIATQLEHINRDKARKILFTLMMNKQLFKYSFRKIFFGKVKLV